MPHKNSNIEMRKKENINFMHEYNISNKDHHLECSIKNAKKTWTLPLVERLSYYSDECEALSFQHDVDAKYYHNLNVTLTLWSTSVSTVSAIAVTGIMSLINSDDLLAFYILTSVTIALNLVTALLNAWIHICDYVYKVFEHSDKSAKFSQLHRKIKNQFSIPISKRYDGKTLLDYTAERFSELDREKPFIRKATIKLWQITNEKNRNELFGLPPELIKDNNYHHNKNKNNLGNKNNNNHVIIENLEEKENLLNDE